MLMRARFFLSLSYAIARFWIIVIELSIFSNLSERLYRYHDTPQVKNGCVSDKNFIKRFNKRFHQGVSLLNTHLVSDIYYVDIHENI